MNDDSQTYTATERKARELGHRLSSYEYLKRHGLLQRPPRWEPETDDEPGPEPPDGDDSGPPYAGAMAMPIPEDEADSFCVYPATIISVRGHGRR